MKYLSVLVLTLLLTKAYSQTDKLDELKHNLFLELTGDFCNCLDDTSDDLFSDKLGECLNNHSNHYKTKYEALISSDTLIDGDKLMDELANTFMNSMQTELKFKCDKYYNYFKKIKDTALSEISKMADSEKLDSLNAIEPDTYEDYYYELAVLNYAEKNYQKAIANMEKSIAKNPSEEKFLFLAWFYTEIGDLQSTIKNIDFYNSTIENEVFKALAKREIADKNN